MAAMVIRRLMVLVYSLGMYEIYFFSIFLSFEKTMLVFFIVSVAYFNCENDNIISVVCFNANIRWMCWVYAISCTSFLDGCNSMFYVSVFRIWDDGYDGGYFIFLC